MDDGVEWEDKESGWDEDLLREVRIQLDDEVETGPLLIALIRENAVLIGGAVLVFGLLGFALGSTRANGFEASAGLRISDPGSGTVFAPLADGGGLRVEDHVADEITVLLSNETIERAISLVGDDALAEELAPDSVRTGTEIRRGDGLTFDVVYTSDNPDLALAMVNSLVSAYRESAIEARRALYANALESVSRAVETAQRESAQLESELRELAAESATSAGLEQRLESNLLSLADLRDSIAGLTADQAAAVAFELQALDLEIQATRSLLAAQDPDPQIATLLDRTNEAIRRESNLRARQFELEVDLASAERIVRTFPATTAEAATGGVVVSTAAGLIFGLFLAVSISYWTWETSSGSSSYAS